MCALLFRDRKDAGQLLAGRLALRGFARPVVLALSPGGVMVAAPIAQALQAPLDVVLAGSDERDGGGQTAGSGQVDGALGSDHHHHDGGAQVERAARYLGGRRRLELAGRTAILVDDGVATWRTWRSVLTAVRRRDPKRVVIAVPAVPAEDAQRLAREADELVLATPASPARVAALYASFGDVAEAEVLALLERAEQRGAGS
jgi:putative phosphoribosyl transferase